MAEVNHLIESGSKKIVGRHQNFLQFLSGFYGHYFNFSGISRGGFPAKTFCLSAFQGFCRADYLFLKILEDADGDEVHKRHMAEGLGLEPGASFRTADIFKRHKQVYATFVDKDDKGHYWLKPDFVILERG